MLWKAEKKEDLKMTKMLTRFEVKFRRLVDERIRTSEAMGGDYTFHAEVPDNDPQVTEIKVVPRWLTYEQFNVQEFYCNENKDAQVIVNGVNWNCRVCYKPPSDIRRLYVSPSCLQTLKLSEPHIVCSSCHGAWNPIKCASCGQGCDMRIGVRLPLRVTMHLKLLQRAQKEYQWYMYKFDYLNSLTEEQLERLIQRELQRVDIAELKLCERIKIKRKKKDKQTRARKLADLLEMRRQNDLLQKVRQLRFRLQAIIHGESGVCGYCYRVFRHPFAKFQHIEYVHEVYNRPKHGTYNYRDRKHFPCKMNGCTYIGTDHFNLHKHMDIGRCPKKSYEEKEQEKICGGCSKKLSCKRRADEHKKLCSKLKNAAFPSAPENVIENIV